MYMKNKKSYSYKLQKCSFANPMHSYLFKGSPSNIDIRIYHDQSENRYSGYIYIWIKELELEEELETAQNFKTFESAGLATRKLFKKTIKNLKEKIKSIRRLEDWYADNFHRI